MSINTDKYRSLPDAFFEAAAEDPQQIVYRQVSYAQDQSWSLEQRSYAEVEERVCRLAAYFKQLGVEAGTKVGILSQSRPEWMEADLALLSLGAVVVSIYQSLPADDIGYILYDSGAEFVVIENEEQLDKLIELTTHEIEIPPTEDRDGQSVRLNIRKLLAIEEVSSNELVDQWSAVLEEEWDGERPSGYGELDHSSLAALVYTSGTTGPPKGVMQTHGNHLANVRQAYDAGIVSEEKTLFLFLPLAHAFARLMGYIGFLTPAELRFPSIADSKTSKLDPKKLTNDIRRCNCNVLPIVPRLLEKMQAAVVERSKGNGLQAKLMRLTLWAAAENFKAREKRKHPGVLCQMAYGGTAAIRQKIKSGLFGSDFKYGVSGGAKLNPDTARFYFGLGMHIIEGYGLTETVVATNVNRFGAEKIGTVGPVLSDDIILKIADDGEILYKGPNIALGYYNRETATRQSWDSDGFFHTGDLGELDEDGYLSIVGRKKEILVSSYGKNIAPEAVEQPLKNSDYISQVVLLGDGRPFCTALITLNEEAVHGWAARNKKTLAKHLYEDPEVLDLVQYEVDKVNEDQPSFSSVRKFVILPGDFTVENGFLTPTFKVKRKLVVKEYAGLIDSLYSDKE